MKIKWFAVMAALNLVIGMGLHAQMVQAGIEAEVETNVDLPDVAVRPARPEKPDRPERPEKTGIGQEMREMVAEFRSKVADLHSEQKELVRRFKDATQEERAEIREQLRASREGLRQVKEEFRDSVKDLTGTLKEQSVRVAAEARAEARSGRSRD